MTQVMEAHRRQLGPLEERQERSSEQARGTDGPAGLVREHEVLSLPRGAHPQPLLRLLGPMLP
jgi:hypothetical protein